MRKNKQKENNMTRTFKPAALALAVLLALAACGKKDGANDTPPAQSAQRKPHRAKSTCCCPTSPA